MRRRLIIVGEGPSPTFINQRVHPLFGNPCRRLVLSAGWSQLGADDRHHYKELLRRGRPVNVCKGIWSLDEARGTASEVLVDNPDAVLVLLGRRVSQAFRHAAEWYEFESSYPVMTVSVPHPSGLNREWNDVRTSMQVGEVLRAAYAVSLHGWD